MLNHEKFYTCPWGISLNMQKGTSRFIQIWLGVMCCLVMAACGNDEPVIPPSDERVTGDIYQDLSSPLVKDADKTYHTTLWSCLYFGQYPANEVVAGSFDAVDDYALQEGDVIVDAELYQRLQQATWEDDETLIDGVRYRRMNGHDAVSCSNNREQHYRWLNVEEYHYFAYAPIKWRVLKITGTQAVLLADRMPDTCPFAAEATDVSWSESLLRQWLNSVFYQRAFSLAEQTAILQSSVKNAPNYYFGTSCGPDTQDFVFILSESEVFSSYLAEDYGFYMGDGIDDPARRFKSTLYAKCRGAWWSPVDDYRGNSFWFMRTNGYTMSNVTYVCDFGYLYNRGTVVTCDDAAVLPAITIDLSKANWQIAPSVSSTDIQ